MMTFLIEKGILERYRDITEAADWKNEHCFICSFRLDLGLTNGVNAEYQKTPEV